MYGDDLAYIHDVGFGDFAAAAAPEIVALLRDGAVAAGLVVELGCGGGLLARRLVDEGYDVLGIDSSRAMIEMARHRVPEAEFRAVSFSRATLPRCHAVVAIGECFNYVRVGEEQNWLGGLLERIYEALRPDGLLLFDVREPGGVEASRWRDFRAGDDWAILFEVEEDRESARLTRTMTTFRKVGRRYRRGEETHVLQLLDASALSARLRDIGFRVRRRRGYGGFRLGRARTVLLARRP